MTLRTKRRVRRAGQPSPQPAILGNDLVLACTWVGNDMVFAPESFDPTYRNLPAIDWEVEGIAPLRVDRPDADMPLGTMDSH